jgi:protein-S-isoprenylcysteine O-methyltransferase Ste14
MLIGWSGQFLPAAAQALQFHEPTSPGTSTMFRWLSLVVLAGALCVSGTLRHRARRSGQTISRRQEGGLWMAMRALVAVPLFLSVILYVVSPDLMGWSTFQLPWRLRAAGALGGLLLLPAVWWVLSSLGRNVSETVLTKSDQQLVNTGPYRWIRHPLYATGIALFAALGLMQASWLVLLLTVIVAASIRFIVIPAEERALLAMFGDRYRTYMRRTGRLLPRVSGTMPDRETVS